MEYKRFDKDIVVRIDKGEEILEKIKEVAIRENIKLATVTALGATNEFTAGVFKTEDSTSVVGDWGVADKSVSVGCLSFGLSIKSFLKASLLEENLAFFRGN